MSERISGPIILCGPPSPSYCPGCSNPLAWHVDRGRSPKCIPFEVHDGDRWVVETAGNLSEESADG